MVSSDDWAVAGGDSWPATISAVADISVVAIAVGSLLLALFALRHQRKHDDRVIKHEMKRAEPYVVWDFHIDDEQYLVIGLTNHGFGPARYIRSEIYVRGDNIIDWNWRIVFDELRQGSKFSIKKFTPTMPKSIQSDQYRWLVGISVTGVTPENLLRHLVQHIELRYFYRSALDDTELETEWPTLSQIDDAD